jgi:hypothetical protein
VVQVESLAGFFPVLNLRKGEQLSRITVVKILSEAVGVLTKFARTLIFHLTAIRARVVAPELLLIEGRPNQIAFKKAQLIILDEGWALLHPLFRGGAANSKTHATHSEPANSSNAIKRCAPSMSRWTTQRTRERSRQPRGGPLPNPVSCAADTTPRGQKKGGSKSRLVGGG